MTTKETMEGNRLSEWAYEIVSMIANHKYDPTPVAASMLLKKILAKVYFTGHSQGIDDAMRVVGADAESGEYCHCRRKVKELLS